MEIDIYQTCPCGSGKKLKFCCHDIVAEMDSISKARATRQPQLILQAIQKLKPTFPNNLWLLVQEASMLMDMQQFDAGRAALTHLLEIDAEHPVGRMMDILTQVRQTGLASAQEKLDLFLQQAGDRNPAVLPNLVAAIGMVHASEGHVMAMRRHAELALAFCPDPEKRESLQEQIDGIDETRMLPYLMRSHYQLTQLPPKGQKALMPAFQWADQGCFLKAGRMFRQAAEKIPQEYSLWRNAGLCFAWGGDEIQGAECLHRAAQADADFDRGVESETLAQLLEYNQDEFNTDIKGRQFEVPSVGRLLTRLDQQAEFVRVPMPPPSNGQDESLAAVYDLIDRPQAAKDAAVEDLPVVQGRLLVYNRDDQSGTVERAILIPTNPASTNDLVTKVRAAAESEIGADTETEVLESFASDLAILRQRTSYPAEMRPALQRRSIHSHWKTATQVTWLETPLLSLKGQTPRAAAADPAQQKQVAAAIIVLEASCEPQFSVDTKSLRTALNVPAPNPLPSTEDLQLDTLSVLELMRLPLDRMSTTQIQEILTQAGILEHSAFLERVLMAAISRPEIQTLPGASIELYRSLCDLCQRRGDLPAALAWISQAKNESDKLPRSFELKIMWDLKELVIRLDDPDDSQAITLAQQIIERYGKKIPGLEEQVRQLLAVNQLEVPFTSRIVTAEVSPSSDAGGVWTPGAETPSGGGASGGLWLPGQD